MRRDDVRRVRPLAGPLDAVGRGAGLEEHRQPGAGLRRARRRRQPSSPTCPTATTRSAMLDCLHALGVGVDARRRRPCVVDAAVGRRLAGRAGHAARRGWPARRRGSSPRSPRSAPGPITIDGLPPLRAPPDGAAARRAGRARRRRSTPGETGRATCRSPCTGPLDAAATVAMPRRLSSQYVTALMLIAPVPARRPDARR